ncbi:MAG: fatty acid CoA ligase family protein [Planctomycetota bacterium]
MTPTCNVASWLALRAAEEPHRAAIYAPDGQDHAGRTRYLRINFQQLHEDSERIARGLRAIGVTPGTRCVLMVPPSLDFFACVFALFKAGAVLVAIDPGIGLQNFKHCVTQARPAVFIGIRKAQLARRLFRWGRGSIQHLVTTDTRDRGRGSGGRRYGLAELRRIGTHDDTPLPDTAPASMAAILFTSGSTGAPKGAVYSHANFDAQLAALRSLYDIQVGEVDLATFPLFALYAPALGMTAVVPDMDFTRPGSVDPERIREPIEAFGVSNLFGSPALLRRVGLHARQHAWRFDSLKRVVSAGAPVPVAIHRLWRELLPDQVQVHTPYGATECLPVASIDSETVLSQTAADTENGAGVCIGTPARNVSVTIIGISDEPIASMEEATLLPTGAIGEICVRAAQATARYFEHPTGTAAAKIADGDGFWHRMGDLGHLDAAGRLWFCGRKAHRIRCRQGELYTVPVEMRVNALAGVYRCALVGVGVPGEQEPVLVVEPETDADVPAVLARIQDDVARYGLCEPIAAVLPHPGLPVDIRHNAKIDRPALARWATRKLS